MKRFLYYFVWTAAIGFIVYIGTVIEANIAETAQETYDMFPRLLFISIFPVILGFLMRLPKFLLERREPRAAGFDWFKFLAVGVPSLYFVLMTFLPYTSLGVQIPSFMLTSQTSLATIATTAGIVFGYVLLDSFHKPEAANRKEVF
ncbi:hypothetical protein [Planomicrobium sp. Y74]|uniref:hypothetical protein n=1 Tax=Planomicrobium sp. Y74 TaxID=2478977 RepID=UPI000EF45646|nr:hypothetical protein [Planomicrobium sp. Y74]RLQ86613.1 hypothetical protein D9754_14375 [Planomicrobium sp. Y74]